MSQPDAASKLDHKKRLTGSDSTRTDSPPRRRGAKSCHEVVLISFTTIHHDFNAHFLMLEMYDLVPWQLGPFKVASLIFHQ